MYEFVQFWDGKVIKFAEIGNREPEIGNRKPGIWGAGIGGLEEGQKVKKCVKEKYFLGKCLKYQK